MTNVSTAAVRAFLLRNGGCGRELPTQLWVSEWRKRRKEARIPLGSSEATSSPQKVQPSKPLLRSNRVKFCWYPRQKSRLRACQAIKLKGVKPSCTGPQRTVPEACVSDSVLARCADCLT